MAEYGDRRKEEERVKAVRNDRGALMNERSSVISSCHIYSKVRTEALEVQRIAGSTFTCYCVPFMSGAAFF